MKVFSINSFLIAILMFVMTFFSYTLIGRVPLYIFILTFIFIVLLANNKLEFEFYNIEFEFYLYIIGFLILILFQYLILSKFNILLSLAGFIAGIGIVFLVRNTLDDITSILSIIEIYIVFQFIIGIIAIIQAFTGHLYPSHLHVDPQKLTGLWHRPNGVEGMTYNFAKNYIFPIIFLFISLKYKLYLYSKIFTKQKIIFLLGFFIVIVILSKTRSTQLALFIMLLGYIFYKYKLFKLEYILGGVFIIGIVVIFIMTHLDLFLDTSSKTRFILWLAGYKMFISHPFIGVGIGEYGDIYEKLKTTIHLSWIGDDYDHRVKAPHNIFVGLLSETGIIGTFFILIAFYKVLKYFKNYEYIDIRLKIISLSIFYYFITFLIDFQFHNYWNDNYYWFWIGIGLSIIWIDQKMKNQLINFINGENKN